MAEILERRKWWEYRVGRHWRRWLILEAGCEIDRVVPKLRSHQDGAVRATRCRRHLHQVLHGRRVVEDAPELNVAPKRVVADSSSGSVHRAVPVMQVVRPMPETDPRTCSIDLGNRNIRHSRDQRVFRADLMAVVMAALPAHDDAQLVTVLLQLVLLDLLVPSLDVSGSYDVTQPLEECRITKKRSGRLRKVQDFLRIHFGCGGVGTELPAHSDAALPAKEATHSVALVLNSDLAERCAKLCCVARNKSLIRRGKGLWVGCELFDGLSRLLYLELIQLLVFFSHNFSFIVLELRGVNSWVS